MMGAERKSHFVTPESKRMTAYHEGGHALVALLTPGSMPLHKVTVLPRGQALGITFQLPEMDRDSFSKTEYLARSASSPPPPPSRPPRLTTEPFAVDVAMGGRVAEELIYGKENVTSGAHSDLVAATNVASAMVKEMGFSDKVRPSSHLVSASCAWAEADQLRSDLSRTEATRASTSRSARRMRSSPRSERQPFLSSFSFRLPCSDETSL